MPLFILWFGIFETSKITLIAVGVFFPVYLGVAGAIAGVDRKLVEVGGSSGSRVSRWRAASCCRRCCRRPSWRSARVWGSASCSWRRAELLGASEGLGYLLLDGQQLGKPDQIVAAILAFAALGKLCDAVLVGLTQPLARWQDTARGVAVRC